MSGGWKFGMTSAAGLLLLLLMACGNAAPTASDVQNELTAAWEEMKAWTGRQVESLDAVNERVTASTKELVSLFGELDYKLAFQENGISFTGASGIEGVVGIQGNLLVLDAAFPGKNAEAAHTVSRIMTVFSETSWAEDRLTAITNGDEPQPVQLDNGWIETDGRIVRLHMEKPIL